MFHLEILLYSGFISREKIFANGWHLRISRIKFSRIAIILAAAWDPDPISMQYLRIIFSRTGTDPRNSRKFSPAK